MPGGVVGAGGNRDGNHSIFKYLGIFLLAEDNNWPAVVHNL